MSSQYTNERRIASALPGSLRLKLPSVSSDSTTPQPKVSCGRLRSTTTISWSAWRRFIAIAKYSPAGPPPRQAIRIEPKSFQIELTSRLSLANRRVGRLPASCLLFGAPSNGRLSQMMISSDPTLGRYPHVLRTLGALALACGLMACRATPAKPAAVISADTWAVVDGRTITRNDVEKAYRRNRDASQPASEEEALTAKLTILNDLFRTSCSRRRAP